ncbi:response regulator transcription factor [Clostridium formicaceticum]|uniref:Stage 0 sporulation protein A homolog n=1 Tax=Clostridium formicaceticum TaxID=1497 RepID=A0AAC9RP20_9CLOT|nr:response regulator transcription factor [Clostridium formicaceticum]AOY77782.1 DNA-binding response regulator [Clostridium formicaceticum]ARE88388.1 Transcriptional regulatory protein SrrA [Clostridium formicaceticum]
MNNILIIEDDESIREILAFALRKESFIVYEASTGQEGYETIKNNPIDLILLDLMLPDISGFDICRKISTEYKTPIIMLTAKDDMLDKLLGLEIGADDYITKPFDVREVITRIKVCLRRIEKLKSAGEENHNRIKLKDNVMIFKDRHEVFIGDKVAHLKPKEYELLIMLAENKGKVFSRDKLLEAVWGYDFQGGSRTVDVHIQRLRKKLGCDKGTSFIQTVFGFGYKIQ